MTEQVSQGVLVQRVLPAAPDRVFSAWVDVEGMTNWISPVGTATVTADVRVGGAFHITMHHEDINIEHDGEYRAIERPSLLQFTWRSQYTGERDTLVTVRIEPHGDGQSALTLTHELLDDEPAKAHQGGWELILNKLEGHLRG